MSSQPSPSVSPESATADATRARRDASLVHWLAQHTGFPASRLPATAELLLLFASAATTEEHERQAAAGPRPFAVRDAAQAATNRQWAQRRNQVHFKCDNSAKV